MGLFNKRRAPFDYGETIEQRATLANPDSWMYDAFGVTPAASGQRVTVTKALGLAPVWSAVSIISEQIGQLPLKVYRDLDGERVEARGSQRWRLLHDKPNEHTPAGRFWATVTNHLLLWGNAFVWKRRPTGITVDELYLLHPAYMTVGWNPETRTKAFVYDAGDRSGRREFTTDEVLHIYGLSLDGVMGESVISHCKNSIGAALARDEFEGSFYNRGANLSGVLRHPRKLSQEAATNLSGSFKKLYGGSGQAHGVPVLEEGMEFQTVGSPMKDLEFVAAQQLTRTDVASMFKLPPNFLGGSSGDSLTYATVESNAIHFAMHAIAPWTTTISQALTYDAGILPQNVFSCEFVLDGMLRADSKTRAEVYTQALNPATGWMTEEEVRRRENLSPAKRPVSPPQQLPIEGLALSPPAVAPPNGASRRVGLSRPS